MQTCHPCYDNFPFSRLHLVTCWHPSQIRSSTSTLKSFSVHNIAHKKLPKSSLTGVSSPSTVCLYRALAPAHSVCFLIISSTLSVISLKAKSVSDCTRDAAVQKSRTSLVMSLYLFSKSFLTKSLPSRSLNFKYLVISVSMLGTTRRSSGSAVFTVTLAMMVFAMWERSKYCTRLESMESIK